VRAARFIGAHWRVCIEGEQNMNRSGIVLFAAIVAATVTGCSSTSANAPRVDNVVLEYLKAGGFEDVSVSQDRAKGVVTLTGKVATDDDKARAEAIAESASAGQVVANEIAVIPPGMEADVKSINSDVDQAIEKNLDAALLQDGLNNDVKFSVKNGVVMLKGDLNSATWRDEAVRVASAVPNVQQVVNEIRVTDRRATSSR